MYTSTTELFTQVPSPNTPSASSQKRLPKVVLAIDRFGWAFSNIALKIKNYLRNEFDIRIIEYEQARGVYADLVIAFWWRSLEQLLCENYFKASMLCVYDHVTWAASEVDSYAFSVALDRCSTVGASNMKLLNQLRYRFNDPKKMFLIEDGVDCEMFRSMPMPPKLTIGWCGNSAAGHGKIKGLELIKEAANKARIDLSVSDVSEGKQIQHETMPAWYKSISAYCCASSDEGTPNPILEAMACGRPVITTRVGITDRLINDGVNGFFADRNVNSLSRAMEKLYHWNMGKAGFFARLAAEQHDWKLKIPYWRNAIYSALGEVYA